MAGSTTSTLDDLLPQIVAEAMFQAEERSIMRGIVKNFVIPPNNGKTLLVPVYPKQTAATWTEGDEISNTAVSTTGVTLTVTPIGLRTLVTDFAVQSAASNVVADLGKLFGEAIARKIDTDLTAEFANFTTNVVGSSTSTIKVSGARTSTTRPATNRPSPSLRSTCSPTLTRTTLTAWRPSEPDNVTTLPSSKSARGAKNIGALTGRSTRL